MKIIYKTKETGQVYGDYTKLSNKPEINSVELLGDLNTEQIKVTWYGTQAEYDAIVAAGTVNPNTIYFINDGSSSATAGDYLDLSNKPSIEGQILTGDKTAGDLNMYNQDEIDLMFATLTSVNVVTAIPATTNKNALYFVGPNSEGYYDVVVYDNYKNPTDLGDTKPYFASEGLVLADKHFSVNPEPTTLYINSSNQVEAREMVGATNTAAGRHGIVPTPVAGLDYYYLSNHGNWNKITTMTGATSSSNGDQGLVPYPLIADRNKFLKGDGTWGDAITAASEGLVNDNGVIKHTNSVTAMNSEQLRTFHYDAQGHITSSTVVTVGDELTYDSASHKLSHDAKTTAATIGLVADSETVEFKVPKVTYNEFGHITSGEDHTVTISTMKGATSAAAGVKGLVPAPAAGDNEKYLSGDGTWKKVATKASEGLEIVNDTVVHTNSVTADTNVDLRKFSYDAQGHVTGDEVYTVGGGLEYAAVTGGHTIQHTNSITADTDVAFRLFSFDAQGHITDNEVYDVDDGLSYTTAAGVNVLGHTNKITAGEVGPMDAEVTQFEVPKIEYDANGHITYAADSTIKISTMTGATDSDDGEKGLVPKPVAGDDEHFLKGDGTWSRVVPSVMVGATSTKDGESGTVPQPLIADEKFFLRGDGTWATLVGDKGITYTSDTNTISHTNNITASTGERFGRFAYDANGHIISETDITAGRDINITDNVLGHSNTKLTAGTAGPTADKTDITFTVPSFSYEEYGHLNAAPVERTFTVRTMTGATTTSDGQSGLIITPTAGDSERFLAVDGTWKSTPLPDDMTGATSTTNGLHGLVPQPTAGQEEYVLSGAATWVRPTKITVSSTEPTDPVSGDVWVKI